MAKKLKGKEWYVLIAPKLFKEKQIGETPVGDPKTLMGRKIDVHIINLIDDLSKYYIKFYFKVKEIKEDISRLKNLLVTDEKIERKEQRSR